VIDPYIYAAKPAKLPRHVEEFAESICLDTNTKLRGIHIIYGTKETQYKPGCHAAIEERIKLSGKDFSDRPTKDIHDRVWIMDDTRAIVTGTSLTGIGCSLSFILDLPDDDLQVLKKFLRDQGLAKA
jgi:hypothetical protein